MVPGVLPGTSESRKLIVGNRLNLAQSGLELIASEAELHQVHTKFTETVIVCFGRELIHRRYGLKNYRVMLDAVNNPRKQVDGPMYPID